MGLTKKQKRYAKAYRDAHKEKMTAYQKIYGADHREEQKAYRDSHKEKMITYQKAYALTKISKEVKTRWRWDNPEKVNAHNITNRAIQNGKLIRSVFCEECGLPKLTQAHHEDYNKPLDVDWLCYECHKAKHVII